MNACPWLLGGDFNVVLNEQEKWGKERLSSYEIEFRSCLHELEVKDLNFSISLFTWTNKQDGQAFVAKKLDRILANEILMGFYGRILVDLVEGGVSVNDYALVSIGRLQSFGPKPFKFFSF